jgi:serine/threonine protein phosphatase PrpC
VRIGRAAGLTDTGRRRLQNEDAFVCRPPLFAVADGMGGAQAGELASGLAASTIEDGGDAPRSEAELAELIHAANLRVFERAAVDPQAAGMGTTATVVVVDEIAGTLTLAHVGDSRAYRVRDGALEQLTSDHSLVAEQAPALEPSRTGAPADVSPPVPHVDAIAAADPVRRHGASEGSRWPALLLLAALVLVAAVALWWGLTR